MYLWEAALGAAEEGMSLKDLRFRHTEHGSPWMEMAVPYLNQEGPLGEKVARKLKITENEKYTL